MTARDPRPFDLALIERYEAHDWPDEAQGKQIMRLCWLARRGLDAAHAPAAEPTQEVALDARIKDALRPLIIYEATSGDATRKVLADDALKLQETLRAAAAALAAMDNEMRYQRDLAEARLLLAGRAGRDSQRG